MNLSGTFKLSASQARVWEALIDPEVLRQCTPGCQQMTAAADGSYDVVMDVAVAAVRGTYKGKMLIGDIIPGSQYKLTVSGSGSTGFLRAEGLIQLKDLGEETVLEYSGQAHVGGPIAGVGQRVMEGVAKQLVGQFFKALGAAVGKGPGA